jgi:hypothetical protein
LKRNNPMGFGYVTALNKSWSDEVSAWLTCCQ